MNRLVCVVLVLALSLRASADLSDVEHRVYGCYRVDSTSVERCSYDVIMDTSLRPQVFATNHDWYVSMMDSLNHRDWFVSMIDWLMKSLNPNPSSSKRDGPSLTYSYKEPTRPGFRARLSVDEHEALKTFSGYRSSMCDRVGHARYYYLNEWTGEMTVGFVRLVGSGLVGDEDFNKLTANGVYPFSDWWADYMGELVRLV